MSDDDDDFLRSSLDAEIRSYESKLRSLSQRRRVVRSRVEEVGAFVDKLNGAANVAAKTRSETFDALRSLSARIKRNDAWTDVTSRTNVTNDCFHIWHRGRYGTINGLRLGGDSSPVSAGFRDDDWNDDDGEGGSGSAGAGETTATTDEGPAIGAPSRDPFRVPWSEFNAALGTAVLLLATLEENPDTPISFSNHRLFPMGNFSRIAVVAPRSRNNKSSSPRYQQQQKPVLHDLFRVDDDSLVSSLFGSRNRDLDRALDALAACLREAVERTSNVDRTFGDTLPHPVTVDSKTGKYRIGGSFVNRSFAVSEEEWTEALKYFLTDLKWIVAFAVRHAES